MGQAHPENGVARFQRREKNRLVRLGPGMRLDVGEIGAEQLFRPVDRQPFDDVDIFAAAVVAPAGVALRVLVGELRALRRQDGRARIVLGGDELDVVFLPLVLGGNGSPDVGIVLGDGVRTMEHGGRGYWQGR